MLNNCTVTGNSATEDGGGVCSYSRLNNCIVYFNTATSGANFDSFGSCVLNSCCTTPLPTNGVGNITLEPQLASVSHLSASSPCRSAGSADYVSGTDIDGEPWATPPSIGCDEYYSGSVTGALSVAIVATSTNLALGFSADLTALINGRTSASTWDFGDGTTVSNRPYASHAWATPGDYAVVLRAYNETHPGGVSATQIVHVVSAPVQYVAVSGNTPLAPYTTWATAATNIQDAVDAGFVGGTILVSNGVYAVGGRTVDGRLTNRVAIFKPMAVRSVNGPELTVIQGYQVPGTTNGDGAIRCVYLTSGASLSGFTLTSGAARIGWYYQDYSGGGVWCGSTNAVVSNCVIVGNSASSFGGGAFGGTLNNCTLTGNMVSSDGGGAYGGTLNNCTLTDNSASSGGGVAYGRLNNCIVYYNTATYGANYSSSTLNYCCTTPQPTSGVGNITNAPLFVDYAGGNLRLQSNSPCINAGLNAYAPGPTDLDGLPRPVSGTVDIGAYEFQGAGMGEFIGWLQYYGLPTDGSADSIDSDGDGMNNWQEWRCGTCPTNAGSALRLLSAQHTGTNVTMTWQSAAGVKYFLERATNLSPSPVFTPLAANIPGQPGTTSYTDTNAAGVSPLFYRVGVGN